MASAVPGKVTAPAPANLFREHQKDLLQKSTKKLAIRLLILFMFSGLGGFLFRWSEGSRELEFKCGVKKVHRDFLDALW